ncbi:MAG: hypothetical protein D6796_00360, partial [Caldilineae bacterium]
MDIGRKLTTLLRATVRSAFTPSRRKGGRGGDAESQVEAARRALAEVEAREQQIAALLKGARAKMEAAQAAGNHAEVQAQQRLIAELEAHLRTQSTDAVRLSERLKALEEALAEKQAAERRRRAAEAAAETAGSRSAAVGGESAPAGDS